MVAARAAEHAVALRLVQRGAALGARLVGAVDQGVGLGHGSAHWKMLGRTSVWRAAPRPAPTRDRETVAVAACRGGRAARVPRRRSGRRGGRTRRPAGRTAGCSARLRDLHRGALARDGRAGQRRQRLGAAGQARARTLRRPRTPARGAAARAGSRTPSALVRAARSTRRGLRSSQARRLSTRRRPALRTPTVDRHVGQPGARRGWRSSTTTRSPDRARIERDAGDAHVRGFARDAQRLPARRAVRLAAQLGALVASAASSTQPASSGAAARRARHGAR